MGAGFDFIPSLLHPSYQSRFLKFRLDISSVTMILTQFKLYTVKNNIRKVSISTLSVMLYLPFCCPPGSSVHWLDLVVGMGEVQSSHQHSKSIVERSMMLIVLYFSQSAYRNVCKKSTS